jgi:hypothetical protein
MTPSPMNLSTCPPAASFVSEKTVSRAGVAASIFFVVFVVFEGF